MGQKYTKTIDDVKKDCVKDQHKSIKKNGKCWRAKFMRYAGSLSTGITLFLPTILSAGILIAAPFFPPLLPHVGNAIFTIAMNITSAAAVYGYASAKTYREAHNKVTKDIKEGKIDLEEEYKKRYGSTFVPPASMVTNSQTNMSHVSITFNTSDGATPTSSAAPKRAVKKSPTA